MAHNEKEFGSKAVLFLSVLYLMMALLGIGESFGAAAGTPQTVSRGGVTAKVTYLNPGGNDDPRFQVVLDTHSVGLDGYDLKSITVLRDDAGKSYLPAGAPHLTVARSRTVGAPSFRVGRTLQLAPVLFFPANLRTDRSTNPESVKGLTNI